MAVCILILCIYFFPVLVQERADVNDTLDELNGEVPADDSDNGVCDGHACPVAGCPRKLKLKRSINRHVRDYHGLPIPGGYCHPRVRCLICQKVCLNTSNYGAHHSSQHPNETKHFENMELRSRSQVLA